MNEKELLDIYTDYLISSFGLATGTGLSRLLDGAISHDQIQRFLAGEVKTGKDLWQTMERGTLSQITQAKCLTLKVTN